MRQQDLAAAIKSLDYLALLEYRQTLSEIALKKDPDQSIARLGRLVGVMLKEPFSEPVQLAKPSAVTSAYRGWNLDESKLRLPAARKTWQYKAIRHLTTEQLGPNSTVEQFVRDAKYERGFFRHLAGSVHRFICGDKTLRSKVDKALKAGTKTGQALPSLSPEAIVAAGGTALGTLLVQSIPVLGMVGAPVIAAIVVMLYTVGVDGFCNWVKSSYETSQNEK